MQSHPFDRYAAFTDLSALLEASGKPLRKSMRINRLKGTKEEFLSWAAEKGWMLEPVPWCSEGYFIDRVDREVALGKDLLHLLGRTYMQEAASMLPVSLLDPKPGETVLDMSAAPGSKTTQMAARMQGRGVIVANDVQEKRLWTLKSSLHRCGVTNVIVTKKVGQWFGKHMTERFDRVLCDAPCTAQGTSRKDSDALLYSSEENVGKMAKLQRELLEAAVHAAKVGGTIVYSTCTLTPEENEGVINSILNKFVGQIEPLELGLNLKLAFQIGLTDSQRVQESLNMKLFPAIRLWPQTYNTEGFFSAAILKTAPTKHREKMQPIRFQETFLPSSRERDVQSSLMETFGTTFMEEGERLFERGDMLILTSGDVSRFELPVSDYSLGLPFGRRLERGGEQDASERVIRVRLDHDIATLRGCNATKSICNISDNMLGDLLDGKDTTCPSDLAGDVLLKYRGIPMGFGLARNGHLKNRLPRWIVQKS
jgi:16S rRNA (cytosine1407-C5)-methyltransferase